MSAAIPLTAAHTAVLDDLSQAAGQGGAPSLAERLSAIRRWLSTDLASVELALSESAQGENLAEAAARHLVALPGKRVRPLAVVLAAKACGGTLDPAVLSGLAVAAELVHAATLLHDDVIDEGMERRGAAASRVVYSNSASVLGGDHLLVTALQRVRRTGIGEALDELLAAIDAMVAAEALQLRLRGTFVPDRDLYMQVIDGKTAALFRWALRAGAMAGGGTAHQVEVLGNVGRALGIVFQLVDDVLDLQGASRVIGKTAMADLREGKLTWPLIIASERSPSLAQRLREAAGHQGNTGPSAVGDTRPHPEPAVDLAALRRDIIATGCLEDTKVRCHSFAQSAYDALAELPQSEATEALKAVVDACIYRIR